jgi:hypothetical protein
MERYPPRVSRREAHEEGMKVALRGDKTDGQRRRGVDGQGVRYYYISRKHVKSKWPKRNDIIVSLFGYDLDAKRALDAQKTRPCWRGIGLCLLISDYVMAIGGSRMLRNATHTSPLNMSVSTHCYSRSLFITESTAGKVDKACLALATMAASIRT